MRYTQGDAQTACFCWALSHWFVFMLPLWLCSITVPINTSSSSNINSVLVLTLTLLDLNLQLFVLKTQIHQQFQDIQAKEPCLTLNFFVIVVDSVLKIKTIVLKEIKKNKKKTSQGNNQLNTRHFLECEGKFLVKHLELSVIQSFLQRQCKTHTHKHTYIPTEERWIPSPGHEHGENHYQLYLISLRDNFSCWKCISKAKPSWDHH